MFQDRKVLICSEGMGPMEVQIVKANLKKYGAQLAVSLGSDVELIVGKHTCSKLTLLDIREKCGGQAIPVSSDWVVQSIRQGHQMPTSSFLLLELHSETSANADFEAPIEVDDDVSNITPKRTCKVIPNSTTSEDRSSPTSIPKPSKVSHLPKPSQLSVQRSPLDLLNPTSDWISGGPAECLPFPPQPPYRTNSSRPRPIASSNWLGALQRVVQDPSANSDVVYLVDRYVTECFPIAYTVVYDGFPKARFHLLVMPSKGVSLGGRPVRAPEVLVPACLPLLRRMHQMGLEAVAAIRAAVDERGVGSGLTFRMGYHSVPSLEPLHLHVVSTDFESECLKHKKHWNSFQPPFFIDSAELMRRLEAGERPAPCAGEAAEVAIKAGLRCHRCLAGLASLPRLREHLRACIAPVALGVVYGCG